MAGRQSLLAMVLVAAALSVGCDESCKPKPTQFTKLEIEISGGFAYIPERSSKILGIAYLNSVVVSEDIDKNSSTPDVEVCNVPQIGTELMVLRGDIDSYQGTKPQPETRIFNLDHAQVTFPQLQNVAFNYPRQKWKPSPLKPPNHGDPAWKDLQYVPKITDHQGLTARKIDPNWRTHPNVNGYMELRGGTLEGNTPSDPIVEKASFEIKVGGVTQDTVSGTDKTIYRVDVPGDRVEITFANASEGYKKLVIKPTAPNAPVRLRLRGLHAMGSGASIKDGDELKDFCVFHTLLDQKVTSDKWVKIYYKAPLGNLSGQDMPSPGYFCEGGSF